MNNCDVSPTQRSTNPKAICDALACVAFQRSLCAKGNVSRLQSFPRRVSILDFRGGRHPSEVTTLLQVPPPPCNPIQLSIWALLNLLCKDVCLFSTGDWAYVMSCFPLWPPFLPRTVPCWVASYAYGCPSKLYLVITYQVRALTSSCFHEGSGSEAPITMVGTCFSMSLACQKHTIQHQSSTPLGLHFKGLNLGDEPQSAVSCKSSAKIDGFLREVCCGSLGPSVSP